MDIRLVLHNRSQQDGRRLHTQMRSRAETEMETETGGRRATTPGLSRPPRARAVMNRDRDRIASVAEHRPREGMAGPLPTEAAWVPPPPMEAAQLPSAPVVPAGSRRHSGQPTADNTT